MTYPTITSLPAAPQRSQDPDTFATTADTFVAALPNLVTEVNAAGDYIDNKTISVGNDFQGVYSAGTTYSTGQSVSFNNTFYLSLVDGNTGNTPDTSPSEWQEIPTSTIPDQSGNQGLFLTTDGNDLSWASAGGGLKSIQVFTSSGTWTKPTGINLVRVRLVGGGGGGESGNTGGGESGAAGGYSEKLIDVSAVSSVTVTVGSGGAGGSTASSTPAGNGGTSSFGSFCSASGGRQGTGVGSGSGGDLNVRGGGGGVVDNAEYNVGPVGGASYFGGGVGHNFSSTGSQGAYGSGGAHNDSGGDGADGISGVVIVEEYA